MLVGETFNPLAMPGAKLPDVEAYHHISDLMRRSDALATPGVEASAHGHPVADHVLAAWENAGVRGA